MTKKFTKAEALQVADLEAAGIPLDRSLVTELTAGCNVLDIYQTGNYCENNIFDSSAGGTGYMASLAIYNESDRPFRIHKFVLEIPWHEPNFQWLRNPLAKVPREYDYSLPKGGPEALAPEVVLNHRVHENGLLSPGDCPEGLLLGVGEAARPDSYGDRQMIQTTISICDALNRYSLNVTLMAMRKAQSKHPHREETNSSTRGVRGSLKRADK